MSFASFPKEIDYADYPESQKLNCEDGDLYFLSEKEKDTIL